MIHNAPIIPIIASILTYFIWCTLSEAAATACLKKHNNNFQFNSNIIEIHQRRCCCCCYRFPRNHNKNIFYRNFSLRHTYVKPSLGTTKERKKERERRVSVSLESKRTREWRVKNKKICGIVKLHLQID